jgi:rubrerythrin
MKLQTVIHQWFLRDLFSTPRGRAYVLSQAAQSESAGEGRIFDVLLEKVDDPDLHRMVQKHQADEARHAKLYSECAERQGAKLPPIPAELRLIDRIDRHIGEERGGVRFFDETVYDDRYVMDGYLLLQVLEERAVQQFGNLATALRPFDPRSAGIVREIEADEARHLKYCHAISRRYAPSQLVLEGTLARFRRAEAKAYQEHTQKSLEFLLREGFLGSRAKTLFWRGFGTAATLGDLPYTEVGRPAKPTRLAAA